jgi:hypothetical protein
MRFYAEQKNRRLRERTLAEDLRIRERYWGTSTPSMYAFKRRVAMAARMVWRVAAGCYSLKERLYIEPPTGLEQTIGRRTGA